MSKLTENLRRSLERPKTPAEKIGQAWTQAGTDEDRAEIREIATAELQYTKSRDETLALLSAVGIDTYEQTEDKAREADASFPMVDPPTYEAGGVMLRQQGLATQFGEGRMSYAEFAKRNRELEKELEMAVERDAVARSDYEKKVNGEFDYAQRFGEDVATDGHGSYDPATHGFRVGVRGTETDPFQVAVEGDLTEQFNAAGSKSELLDVIRRNQGKTGLVLDDQ